MNVAFNEISIYPYTETSYALKEHFLQLAKTYKKLKQEYGIDHIVFPTNLAELNVLKDTTIHQWLSSLSGLEKEQIMNLIRRKPFSQEILEGYDEDIDKYVFENNDLQINECICIGLGLAEICQTATLSLNTNIFWQSNRIAFNKLDYITEERIPVSVSNCCLDKFSQEFTGWIESLCEVELITSDILPSEKTIKFRDDHGTDILQAFANRLVNSEYVISIINSIPFNPNTSRFIRKCYSDGKIELILHWEDAGYGMVIQSTGRNFKETEEIAKLIQEKYDR